MRCLRPWLDGGDPMAPLAYEAPLTEVKRRLAAEPGYFQGLIGATTSSPTAIVSL